MPLSSLFRTICLHFCVLNHYSRPQTQKEAPISITEVNAENFFATESPGQRLFHAGPYNTRKSFTQSLLVSHCLFKECHSNTNESGCALSLSGTDSIKLYVEYTSFNDCSTQAKCGGALYKYNSGDCVIAFVCVTKCLFI